MWEEVWTEETGEWVGKKKKVKDDRGHLLLYVHPDFVGHSALAPEEAVMYGKKLVSDGGEANVALTEGVKERLGLLGSDIEHEFLNPT